MVLNKDKNIDYNKIITNLDKCNKENNNDKIKKTKKINKTNKIEKQEKNYSLTSSTSKSDDLFKPNNNFLKKVLNNKSKLKNEENSKSSSNNSSMSENNKTHLNTTNSSSSSSSNPNKKLYKKIEDKNIYFNELLKKQINNIPTEKKLTYNDIKRISKFIKSSIFNKKKCTIWNGYITNENNNTKGTYINFYFNKKKIALHRLLFINYIGPLSDNEYLKFSCENKGKCCNIHHMNKYTYNNQKEIKKSNKTTQSNNEQSIDKSKEDEQIVEVVKINVDKKKLIVEI